TKGGILKGCKTFSGTPPGVHSNQYRFSGGLRFAATTGYSLATLWVARRRINLFDANKGP
ncbi:MAG TPA: hypothetical protein VJV03_03670, partial [Pyrinomonadaceae bacterium]|nr:hypothetical protein [Pyrinomonadaceae bacterium]